MNEANACEEVFAASVGQNGSRPVCYLFVKKRQRQKQQQQTQTKKKQAKDKYEISADRDSLTLCSSTML